MTMIPTRSLLGDVRPTVVEYVHGLRHDSEHEGHHSDPRNCCGSDPAAGHVDQDEGDREGHEVVPEECFLKDQTQAQADGDSERRTTGSRLLPPTSPDPTRQDEGKRNRHCSGNHQQSGPGEMELPHDGPADHHACRTILYPSLELVKESPFDLL